MLIAHMKCLEMETVQLCTVFIALDVKSTSNCAVETHTYSLAVLDMSVSGVRCHHGNYVCLNNVQCSYVCHALYRLH